MITGIVVALTEELTTLTSERIKKGSIHYFSEKIWIIYSGAGEKNARLAAELLVDKGVNRLISWGCAAALDATLKPGDLVLAESCIDTRQMILELENQAWVNDFFLSFDNLFPVHFGRIAESREVVETADEKARLGVATGAIALDMESTAIARVANSNGIALVTIRVIADTLAMDLPKAVSYALNDDGDVVLRKLLFYLLRRPSELQGLIKLGLAFNKAKKSLKCVAAQLEVVTRYGTT